MQICWLHGVKIPYLVLSLRTWMCVLYVVTGGVMGKASSDWLLLVPETISDFSHLLSSSDPLLAGDTDIRPEYILYCGGLSTKKNYLTIDLVQFSVIYSDVFCMTNKKKDIRFIH